MYRRSNTSRLWTAIAVLAIGVAAMFVVDPFAPSDEIPNDEDAPFVAILARDEIVHDEPAADPEPGADEVLGRTVTPGDPIDEPVPAPAPATTPPETATGDESPGSAATITERGLRDLGE